MGKMTNQWWSLVLISESGREIPHWSAPTREACRRELNALKAQCGGKLPSGVHAIIVKGSGN